MQSFGGETGVTSPGCRMVYGDSALPGLRALSSRPYQQDTKEYKAFIFEAALAELLEDCQCGQSTAFGFPHRFFFCLVLLP